MAKDREDKERPFGSGLFSFISGVIFLAAFSSSFVMDLRNIDPYVLFRFWLLFVAAILLIWGSTRMYKALRSKKEPTPPVDHADKGDRRLRLEVGQSTLNFVVGIVGATAAIFAFVVA